MGHDGISYQRPEIVRFFKARPKRAKDEVDFELLPHLSVEGRDFFARVACRRTAWADRGTQRSFGSASLT